MSKIILTADGEQLVGRLPAGWGEVPLAGYAALAGAADLPARITATAALVGLPAEPLLYDVNLYAQILAAAPWLFREDLPTAEPTLVFSHQGTKYTHVGNLAKINAGQLEALLDFLRTNEGHHLNCGPALLAVLYCPKGRKQTPEVVRDTAQAFATLPMSIAWPALADFTRSSGRCALDIRSVFALREQVEMRLAELAQQLTTGGASFTFSRRPLRWLSRMWLASARSQL